MIFKNQIYSQTVYLYLSYEPSVTTPRKIHKIQYVRCTLSVVVPVLFPSEQI